MESQKSIIYAELLSNIRQISLAVSLSSPGADDSTRVLINTDATGVELRHRGETYTLKLPSKVSLGGTALPIQKQGVTTLSWRLPLYPSSTGTSRPSDMSGDQTMSWTAVDLQAGSAVSCRKCESAIVKSGAINAWKDLPSENWAEMMEFWHCHKPDTATHHSHGFASHNTGASSEPLGNGHSALADDKSLAARGYGASSTISAQEGVGFVDLTTLLFAESDCAGITFSPLTYEHGSVNRQNLTEITSSEIKSLNIFCSSCHAQIGFFSFRTAAVTLLKWQVLCKSSLGTIPDISQCLSATLISTKARSGSAKSLIMPIPETITSLADSQSANIDTVIYTWVLNPSIVYSSSGTVPTEVPGIPAIKLLYQLITQEEADRTLEGLTCDAQEINLPSTALGEVIQLLDESNMLLPVSERGFKEWKVGLLSR